MTILQSNDEMYVCPDCGSASVEFSGLAGGVAECNVCSWAGTRERLLNVPFDNRMGSPLEVAKAIRIDLRRAFAVTSKEFVRFLVKWGFVPAVERGGQIEVANQKTAVRYMNVISQATLKAVLEERQKIEAEKYDGN